MTTSDPAERNRAERRLWPRRHLILAATAAGSLLLPSPVAAKRERKERDSHREKAEVTPPEDLMREHGVLDRVLLVYEACLAKLAANEDFDPAIIRRGAEIVRDFIQNYHEKSEEEAVFPRFKKAGKEVALVDTLLAQHEAGRRVTQIILQADDRSRITGAIRSFIAMYRPHAAREDTDLFPKLRSLVSSHEYDAMAEDFEKKEHRLFGADGFEMMVSRVAGLEQSIGIGDLAQFTPPLSLAEGSSARWRGNFTRVGSFQTRGAVQSSAAFAEEEMIERSGSPRQTTSIHVRRREAVLRRRRASGFALGIAGVAMSVFAYALTTRPHSQVAQYAQSQTAPRDQTTGQTQSPPAESKPGGTRPTTPAPEPARPDPEAQKQGAPAALPPAPAEKTAPPISK